MNEHTQAPKIANAVQRINEFLASGNKQNMVERIPREGIIKAGGQKCECIYLLTQNKYSQQAYSLDVFILTALSDEETDLKGLCILSGTTQQVRFDLKFAPRMRIFPFHHTVAS